MMTTHPAERFSQWWLSIGVGGMVACAAGLFGAAPSVVFLCACLGFFCSLTGAQLVFGNALVTAHNWDLAERQVALDLKAPPVIVEQPTETPAETQERERREAWRGALVLFLQHAERAGSLTSRALIGVAVSRPDDWESVTRALIGAGLAYSTPRGTRLKLETYGQAVAAAARADELPEGWPPRIAPLSRPEGVVIEHQPA